MKKIIYEPYLQIGGDQVTICYQSVRSIQQIECPSPQKVTRLVLAHCALESLRGIERYQSLQVLNLKYNNLEEAQELYRVKNRAALRELNLEGNTIEYYALCTYHSLLKNGFTNLAVLNGKDYTKWSKSRTKAPTMSKLNKKLQNIERQMGRTLKRVVKSNVMQKYRLITELQPSGEQQQEPTSRYSSKHHLSSLQQFRQNDTERVPLKEISLSNVHLAQSVKPPQSRTQAQRVVHEIELPASDLSRLSEIVPPTATFKQQEAKQTFKSRTHYRNMINEADENQEYLISEQNRYDDNSFIHMYRDEEQGDDSGHWADEEEKQMALAVDFHTQSMYERVFKAMAPNNMPRRMNNQ